MSHVIIDGIIDIPRTKAWKLEHEDAKLDPQAVSIRKSSRRCFRKLICQSQIAESYWHLHTQPRTTFGSELDLRPYMEKW